MANYVVDPDLLSPFLPYRTELDIFEGKHFVSLVGFMFTNTRLLGFKIPFHVNFEEVNLRFYVRYNDAGAWKRGTVFIKEIVPKPAISFIANNVYHEKYCTKRMRHVEEYSASGLELSYQWRHRGKWNEIAAKTESVARPMIPGSEAQFIAEHYWGYSRFNERTSFEYQVQHPPWNIFPVNDYKIDCDFGSLYGPEFSILENLEPNTVFVAEGSAVTILQKRRL